jgi:transcriptional regulator with XRE-family HTH domain
MPSFADSYRNHLSLAGLSYAAVARQCRISKTAVADYATGIRVPPLDQVERLLAALDLSPADQARLTYLAHRDHCPPAIRQILDRHRIATLAD